MPRQGKRQRDEGQLREVVDRKYPCSSNYALVTKKQYVLPTVQTITRTILVTCTRYRLFLHLSCLKTLRSSYLPFYLNLLTTICHFVLLWE